MTLTGQAVDALAWECMFREGEDQAGALKVAGIVNTYGFHPGRIAENIDVIAQMLAELPAQFHAKTGGGWTFLNICEDRHGEQWTGFHAQAERLCCLGIAAGLASWSAPRELWEALPGAAPYFTVGSLPA